MNKNLKEKALERARMIRIYIRKFKTAEREVMIFSRKPRISVEYNDMTFIMHGMFQPVFPGIVIPQSLVCDVKVLEKEVIEFHEKKFSVDLIERRRLQRHFRLAVSIEERLHRIFVAYAHGLK